MSESATLLPKHSSRKSLGTSHARRINTFDTVSRPRLLRAAREYLSRDGLLALCSERGMGRHVLAEDLAKQHRTLRGAVRSIRVLGGTPDNSCRRLRRCVNESIKAVNDGTPMLIIAEGLGGVDDPFAERMAKSFELAVHGGCQVLVIAEPEAETIFDKLPNCHVMRAQELALDEEEYFAWGNLSAGYAPELVTRATHGIPALVAALKNTTPSISGMPSGPAWDRTVNALVKDALRPSLIEEEQRLRCAMAALGKGEISELENIGVRVSRDLLEETALSAPIFGANAQVGSFGLVPCEPSTVARAISKSYADSDLLVIKIIRVLSQRGDIARAAALAATLSDNRVLDDLAFTFPFEFIDAGLTGVLEQVLNGQPANPMTPIISEILELTYVLDKPAKFASFEKVVQVSVLANRELGLQLELLRAHHHLLQVRETQDSEAIVHIAQSCHKGETSSNLVTRKLACHVCALLNLNQGNALASFRELMVAKNLREFSEDAPSVFSAVLQLEFEAVRSLLGDPEHLTEASERALAESTLLRFAPVPLRQLVWLWRDMALIVSGTLPAVGDFSRALLLHGQNKEHVALAWTNIFASCIEISNRSYKQAHIHAIDARKYALEAHDKDAAIFASLCKLIALHALGEAYPMLSTTLQEDVLLEASDKRSKSPIGIAAFLVAYAELIELSHQSGADVKRAALLSTLRLRVQKEPPEIISLFSFIARIDRRLGSVLEQALPRGYVYDQEAPANQSNIIVPTKDLVLAGGSRAQGVTSGMQRTSSQVTAARPLLEIQVMGDIKVRLCGNLIGEASWRRSHPKIILAYLALKSEHNASRIELIDQLWPDADYQRGRESLYTALSSMRQTIGQTRDSAQFVVADIGRLSLDTTLVSCDVDMFEKIAKRVQVHKATDEEIVSQCLRLETLYGSGSFIPSIDATGFFKERHAEIRRRFADVLLKGSEAATRLGDTRQASWLLSSAQALLQEIS